MRDVATLIQTQDKRAEEVRQAIKQIHLSLSDHTFDLAALLVEIQDNNYPALWGFKSFETWLESSELDIKSRQSSYLIRIVKISNELQISRSQLRLVKISKLKAIFTLNPAEFADEIKDLVTRAVNMSLAEVEAEVKALKGETGDAELTWRNFRINKLSAENTVDPAIESIRAETNNDCSDGEALVLICAERLAEIQLQPNYADTRMREEESIGSSTT